MMRPEGKVRRDWAKAISKKVGVPFPCAINRKKETAMTCARPNAGSLWAAEPLSTAIEQRKNPTRRTAAERVQIFTIQDFIVATGGFPGREVTCPLPGGGSATFLWRLPFPPRNHWAKRPYPK